MRYATCPIFHSVIRLLVEAGVVSGLGNVGDTAHQLVEMLPRVVAPVFLYCVSIIARAMFEFSDLYFQYLFFWCPRSLQKYTVER